MFIFLSCFPGWFDPRYCAPEKGKKVPGQNFSALVSNSDFFDDAEF